MANDGAHYRELAARAQAEADDAKLDNVRDRALRSAAVFENMALQYDSTANLRAAREASVNHAQGAAVDVLTSTKSQKEHT
jgi:hypothetical protein